MSHYYLMNYTLKFTENYKNSSQWIYNHFTAAHEASGQHSQTLDKDLKEYITTYITKYGNTHEIIIFLNGDHGMRYGGYMIKPESMQEYKLPACFIIANTAFLEEIHAKDALIYNSYRLTSKPDLRQSMLYLASLQNLEDYNKDNEKHYNLFKELIQNNRKCSDIGISS